MTSLESIIVRPSIILICLFSIGLARDDNSHRLAKPSTREFIEFTGNNINSWLGNQGHLASHIPQGYGGCEWPAGSGKTVIYASGIWITGQVDGELRSAAAENSSEWTPGTIPYDTQTKLPTNDTPDNTPDHQIYAINNWDSSDPTSDSYNREYANWPASDGAPAHDGEIFTDLNSNGLRDPGEPYEDFNQNASYDPPDGQYVTGEDPPIFKGDEQAWWVMNDWWSPAHDNLWRTEPLGLEMQVTVYNQSMDLFYENVQFHDVTLVNKSGHTLDSVYYAYWSDVDLGDASDDQGGCDSSLSLGYYYNGKPRDQRYGMTPPAVGYTFLQGPMVESIGDTVVYGESVFSDKMIQGMTAHILILKGSRPFSDPENERIANFYMQGFDGEGNPIMDTDSNVTTFHVSGDPVLGDEWTALNQYYLSDKRALMSCGPFNMAPWDDINQNGLADFGEPGVQVIKSALIIVAGVDYLDAITSLKYATGKVRSDFHFNFETPELDPPQLSASANDQEIALNWHAGAEEYEVFNSYGYQFEGYNIYQAPSANGPWTRLHTFDVVNDVGHIVEQVMDENGIVGSEQVQFGEDAGLQYLLNITEDALQEGAPLTNNKLYHFALSAYAYNGERSPKSIESSKRIVSIRPHLNYELPGMRDTLDVAHTGNADVKLTIDVLDPGALTGLDYELGFQYDSSAAVARWHILRKSGSFQDTALLGDWTDIDWFAHRDYTGEKAYLDGFEISLDEIGLLPPRKNHSWKQNINVQGDSTWVESYLAISPGGVDSLFIKDGDTLSLNEYFETNSRYNYPAYFIREEGLQTWFDIPRSSTHKVILSFGSNFGAIGGDRLSDIPNIGGGSEDPEFYSSDLEIRFTENGQFATKYQRRRNDSLVVIPFEVWDIERDRQLVVGIKDNNKTGGIQDTSLENWESTLDLDWVIVFDLDYSTHADSIQELLFNPHSGWAWQFNDNSRFSVGDLVTLHFVTPINTTIDSWVWSTAAMNMNYDEDALDLIQVFPNPYFGYHSDQTTASGPYVTFSNLPAQESTIRIYDLGGHLVRRFDHESGSYENWNLQNEWGSSVASGIYIVHVEVPNLGNKILKVAVFQPE
ncbi:MAG: T9SS type A sorting domain-containing protein [Candidatus Marinimicrobia bacterium]|nr:T9SS type A sorting domain-containing protein [Candidatus Neomarinimicrobiota bacterium]